MPNLPADKLLLHQATQFLEDAISFMANEGDLITFAQDHETREMAAIVDPPMPAYDPYVSSSCSSSSSIGGPICGRPFSDPRTRRGGHVKITCKKKHGQAFYSKFT